MHSTQQAPDWDDLRLLLAILETHSLSAAADATGISQPTVSRKLAALERQLGGPLVQRGPRGCRPTERGAALAPLISSMQRAAASVAQAAQSAPDRFSGTVRIAAGALVARCIARNLQRILAGTTGLQLDVVAGVPAEQVADGNVDLALRNRASDHDALEVRPLGSSPFAIYGAASYVEHRPAARDADRRFADCSWVRHSNDRLGSSAWLQRRLAPDATVQRFDSSIHVLEALASGAGLGVLPRFAGDDDPRLLRVSDDLDALEIPAWMLSRRAGDSRDKRRTLRFIAERVAAILAAPTLD